MGGMLGLDGDAVEVDLPGSPAEIFSSIALHCFKEPSSGGLRGAGDPPLEPEEEVDKWAEGGCCE